MNSLGKKTYISRQEKRKAARADRTRKNELVPKKPKAPKGTKGGRKRGNNRRRNPQPSKGLLVSREPTDISIPKTDARVASTATVSLSLANQLKTITINKVMSAENLIWLGSGYISKALERGFAAGASTVQTPYYALTFLVNLVAAYCQGGAIPVTQMPYWLLCLCHAVSQKTVRFSQGTVNYAFTVESTLPIVPGVTTIIGYVPYGYQYTLGWNTGTAINGFPTVVTLPVAYTDQLGAIAFQELAQFMAHNSSSPKGQQENRLVPSTLVTPFISDVSAFALFRLAEGLGATGTGGGIYGQAQLEVPLLHPLLSLVSCGIDSSLTPPPTRNFNWTTPIAGDPTFLGAMMPSSFSTRELSAKRNMRFKPVDFLEFGDVVAQWVQQITQAYFQDVQETATIAIVDAAFCPLTLQEMLLILRNTMMGAFKKTQAAVQGLYPYAPSGMSDSQFVPYVASANTCSLNTLDMELPMPLIENIRALVARKIKFPASAHDVVWYCPILGQYSADVLVNADYPVTYINEGVPGSKAAFGAGALWEEIKKGPKGEEVRTRLVEAPISLIDGASSTNLVAINDPDQLKILVAMWNNWLKNSGVQTFSVQTGTLGTEAGINALCSISMTRIWVNTPQVKEFPKIRVEDVRLRQARYRAMVNTPFSLRQAVIDTSQGEILSAAYEQVLQTWILPIDENEFDNTTSQSVDIQRWQFMMDEPYSISRSSGENGVSMGALHLAYAAKMTKGKFAATDDWTSFFDEMAKTGRGGILSGLVAGLVGSAFPSLAGTASSIANALPF